MQFVKIDVKKGEAYLVEHDTNKDILSWFYNQIDCAYIDIATRRIGNKIFDIVCDDEGLLKPNRVSALDENYSPALVGNLIICKHDRKGNARGLTQNDIECIMSNVYKTDYGILLVNVKYV